MDATLDQFSGAAFRGCDPERVVIVHRAVLPAILLFFSGRSQ